VITVSDFNRDRAVQLGVVKDGKVISIPNGIDPNRVKASRPASLVRDEIGVLPEEAMIFSAGRLAAQKGFEYLIESMPLLASAGTRFKVVLAGEGPLRTGLEKKAEDLGMGSRISFLLLAACDIVALPSL
jgi:glycosyltransferase involved in cell wall biosynthesis